MRQPGEEAKGDDGLERGRECGRDRAHREGDRQPREQLLAREPRRDGGDGRGTHHHTHRVGGDHDAGLGERLLLVCRRTGRAGGRARCREASPSPRTRWCRCRSPPARATSSARRVRAGVRCVMVWCAIRRGERGALIIEPGSITPSYGGAPTLPSARRTQPVASYPAQPPDPFSRIGDRSCRYPSPITQHVDHVTNGTLPTRPTLSSERLPHVSFGLIDGARSWQRDLTQ